MAQENPKMSVFATPSSSGHGFPSAPDRITITSTSQPASGLTFRVEESKHISDSDKKSPPAGFVVLDPLREQLAKVEAENIRLRKKLEKVSTELHQTYVRPIIDPDIVAFMERDLALIEESRKALREKALALATGWLADKVVSVGTIPDSAPVHYAVLADILAMLEQAGHAPFAFVCSYWDFADVRKMDTPHVRWEGKRAFIFGYEVFCTRDFTGYFLAVAEGAVAVADVPR